MNFILKLLAVALLCAPVLADTLDELQQGWAHANYELEDDLQSAQFEALIASAEDATKADPTNAELLVWEGIIKSTYAGKSGGLTALSMVKQARMALEQALEIDDSALNGSAYTSLGALYYQVPGWPIAFGNDKKAKKLLEKALQTDPAGIDSNYFYADFLIQQKEYDAAKQHLAKALQANPRPGREIADAGRRSEILALLSSIET
ncbi:MAG: tetratricopeptide repeat protein [Pseudohongiellaceae bacterium]